MGSGARVDVRLCLEIAGVSKRFGEVAALDKFDFRLGIGEVVGLVGPNGAGKTTLFNLISGILRPDCGVIRLQGRDIAGLPPHRIARMGVGRLFQELRLVRQVSVLENVLLSLPGQPGETLSGLSFRCLRALRTERANRLRAMSILESVGLANKAHDAADALSYGQQKLLAIGCVVGLNPALLLMDEPISGIAPTMAEVILAMIAEQSEHGRSVILIDHNLDAVAQVCRRIVFLEAGRKATEGTPEEIRCNTDVMNAYLE